MSYLNFFAPYVYRRERHIGVVDHPENVVESAENLSAHSENVFAFLGKNVFLGFKKGFKHIIVIGKLRIGDYFFQFFFGERRDFGRHKRHTRAVFYDDVLYSRQKCVSLGISCVEILFHIGVNVEFLENSFDLVHFFKTFEQSFFIGKLSLVRRKVGFFSNFFQKIVEFFLIFENIGKSPFKIFGNFVSAF